MAYFLISANQFQSQSINTKQFIAWSFDNTKCIIETNDDKNIENHLQRFETSNECNQWRYNEASEEWRNWISEEDFLGT